MASTLWKDFYTGSVVRWNGSLWVVTSVEPKGLRLVLMTGSNVSAFPSTEWPGDRRVKDPNTGKVETITGLRVETVEFVANCVSEYVLRVIHNPFHELLCNG